MKRLGFFPRLLLAFLLVILVAGSVVYAVSSALMPSFLQTHLESMNLTSRSVAPGTAMMLTDLEVGYRAALTQSLFWAVIVALLVGGALSLYITLQITRPLARMRGATRRIATGEYGERVGYAGPGEVGELADDFNTMAETLQASEAQRSDLVRNLAHEFRTPLMNLRGYVEGVEDGVFEFGDTTEATKRQLERLERLMNDLALLSRVDAKRESVTPEQVSLEAICSASINAVRPQFLRQRVSLRCKPIPPELLVMADPIRSEQVLTNLLMNALRHTPAGGEVVLWAARKAPHAVMHVKDTGEGIPQDALPHIFERFYRAGGSRNVMTGSGIGLTIARYFVEAQGGKIKVESTEGQGSHFWFTLPLA